MNSEENPRQFTHVCRRFLRYGGFGNCFNTSTGDDDFGRSGQRMYLAAGRRARVPCAGGFWFLEMAITVGTGAWRDDIAVERRWRSGRCGSIDGIV
jgi:hypothetical protein